MNNWKVARSAEIVNTPDKYRIGGGSNGFIIRVAGRKLFCARCKHCNENERRYFRRFRNWAEEIHG